MPSVMESLRRDKPKKDDENVLTFQYGGYLVHVGCNAFSNEKLISEHPHRDCIWMHATAARGSHVVLCTKDKPEPEEGIIQFAAGLALRHSHSEARTVSVSFIKDLSKPEGGGVGVWKPSKQTMVEVI